MSKCQRMTVMAGVLMGLVGMVSSVSAQVTPPIQNGQVEIMGALPRAAGGAVDVEALKQTVQTQFARPGVQEIQFRGFTLSEEEQRALFLNVDPNKNVLRQVSTVVPTAGGAERHVTFRSSELRARVGREEGQLRARIDGIDTASLTEAERQSVKAQFDRFRLESGDGRGAGRAGNRSGRDGGDHSGPGSANSGPGSANSGSGRGGDSGRRGGDDLRVAQAGDIRQEDRQQDRREDRQVDRQQDRREDRQADRREDRREDRRSNVGGELRGLDRADRVAGDRGQQGRDNARAAQMERPSRIERIERVERPQRPDRPERPQRPERPERPERSGRN